MRYRSLFVLTLIFAVLGTSSLALAQSSLETYTSQDGTITLNYPQGWRVYETQGVITLTTNPSLPEDFYGTLQAGEASFSLFMPLNQESFASVDGFLTTNTVIENLQAFANTMKTGSQPIDDLGEVTSLTIGEYPAAVTSGTFNATGNDTEIILIDFENDNYGLISIQTAPGELARVEPKIRSIAATIEYTPPSANPTAVNLSALIPIGHENASSVKLLSSFSAHNSTVNSVAISPNEKTIASGGEDGGIHLWDAATGELKTSTAIQDGSVVMVLFTPDGQTLISAADDGVIKLWNAETGEQQQMIQEDGAIWFMAISPDSQNLAFISYVRPKTGLVSSTVWLWDLAADAPQTIEVYPGDFFANSLSFSPDGQQLLYSAGVDNRILVKLYDVSKGELSRWSEQGSPIDVFFTADGTPYLSKSADYQTYDVQIVNLQTDDIQWTLSGHQDVVYQTILNSTRTVLGTPSFDSTTRLWDIQTGDLLASLPHNDRAIGIAFSHDGRLLVTSDAGGTVYLWGITTNN